VRRLIRQLRNTDIDSNPIADLSNAKLPAPAPPPTGRSGGECVEFTGENPTARPLAVATGLGISAKVQMVVDGRNNNKLTAHGPRGRATRADPPYLADLTSVAAITLQLIHLVFDLELFLLQPADLELVGAWSRHFFLDLQLQCPVLFEKLGEMSGKRHIALRLGVEGASSVTWM